ncbi:MAG: TIM barrel protein [Acidobacteria bacterium]|nr:TIM barrel protein [Acidobacteriota bacterium]
MREMTISLSPGAIGVKATQDQAIEFAHYYGYEAVEPYGETLAGLSLLQIKDLAAKVQSQRLVWGSAGLTVEYRKDSATFEAGMAKFPAVSKALAAAGVKRVSTWIMPGHEELTYTQNMKMHAERLRAIATVCKDNGQRLGLEYVGPKTLWTSRRFPFLHTMAECKDLIAAIGTGNVGFVLDSWHWQMAGEKAAELKTLTNADIVSVDLNDAPAGIAADQQIDSQRELPLATGVLDVKTFLNTLNELGCDAPVRCEPFNAPLRALPAEQALTKVADAMKRAMALIA